MQRHLRRLWKRYLKWPAPLWRLRGHTRLSLAGHEFRFYVDDATIGWARRVWRGKWEPGVREFLSKEVRPGDVFLDVGAYVGGYTLLASKLVRPGGWVYSFEPDPAARRLLERNVAANEASNVTVLPYGVTDCDGSAWLRSHRLGGSGSAVTQDGGLLEIETVTLRSFCQKQGIHPSVIKIDVEGGEAKVVRGGTEILQNARVILLEFHESELREAGEDPSMFCQSLFNLAQRIIVLHQRGGDGLLLSPELSRAGVITGTVNLALL